MMFRRLAVVAVFTSIWSGTVLCAWAGGEPDGQRWWSHVLVLADDRLEGRGTGSPGHRKAAEYVAREFERAGLKPAGTDAIYTGAMDNASGIAAMLDVAAILKESGTTLLRSVLFVAVTGEEKGLLGSKFFANVPTVDRRAIVANINKDSSFFKRFAQ